MSQFGRIQFVKKRKIILERESFKPSQELAKLIACKALMQQSDMAKTYIEKKELIYCLQTLLF